MQSGVLADGKAHLAVPASQFLAIARPKRLEELGDTTGRRLVAQPLRSEIDGYLPDVFCAHVLDVVQLDDDLGAIASGIRAMQVHRPEGTSFVVEEQIPIGREEQIVRAHGPGRGSVEGREARRPSVALRNRTMRSVAQPVEAAQQGRPEPWPLGEELLGPRIAGRAFARDEREGDRRAIAVGVGGGVAVPLRVAEKESDLVVSPVELCLDAHAVCARRRRIVLLENEETASVQCSKR